MMKRLAWGIVTAVLLLSLMGMEAKASEGPAEKVPVIIGFKEGCSWDQGMPFGPSDVIHEYPGLNAVAVLVPQNAVDSLGNNPKVEYVEYDGLATASAEVVPWGVDRIDADKAWAASTGSGVTVAVIDTGIDKDHPDLAGNILGGTNYVRKGKGVDPARWDDDNGHGSHCAGVIAAVDNEEGVVGVASDAGLYGVKVLNKFGNGYISDIVAGMQWAIAQEVDVISMSLSTSGDYDTLEAACDAAEAAKIVVVASAGNQGDGQSSTTETVYPAAYDSVIAVAATDAGDDVAYFSNSGSHVELAAPGVSVYSTYKDGGYNTMSGTSMACPHVAGTAALILAANPTFTNADVRQRLVGTAEDLGPTGKDNSFGYGLVDAEEAVGPAVSDTTPPVISNVAVTGITGSGATITWTTDEPSDSLVRYGTTTALGSEAPDGSLVTSHSVTLVGLVANTPYHFEVESKDASGNTATDNNDLYYYEFTTAAPGSNVMHVHSIDMWYQTAGKNVKVFTEVMVANGADDGLPGATVQLDISLPGGGTAQVGGLTGTGGTVILMYGPTKVKGTYISTVTGVAMDGWTYDPEENLETSEQIDVA